MTTRGQHLAEYAIVIGIGAAVAVSLQLLTRRVAIEGLRAATDTALPPPGVHADEPDVFVITSESNVAEHGIGQHRWMTEANESDGFVDVTDTQFQAISDCGGRPNCVPLTGFSGSGGQVRTKTFTD